MGDNPHFPLIEHQDESINLKSREDRLKESYEQVSVKKEEPLTFTIASIPKESPAVVTPPVPIKSQKQVETVPDELADGPIDDGHRGFTDILCCLIFMLFWIGLIVIAVLALKKGDPNRITQAYDPDHNACGSSPGYENYPYIYFAFPSPNHDETLSRTVCVSECPDGSEQSLKCIPNSLVTTCNQSEAKKVLVYKTTPILERICIPTDKEFFQMIKSGVDIDKIQKHISDVFLCWKIILACAGVALVIGFLYMFIVRFCAAILVWVSILLIIAGLGIAGWQLLVRADEKELKLKDSYDDHRKELETNKVLYHRIGAYTLFVVSGLVLIISIIYYRRINLGIAVIRVTARFTTDVFKIILIPPILFLLFLATFAYFIWISLYLYSAGTPYHDDTHRTPFASLEYDEVLRKLTIFHIFGCFWSLCFNVAFSQFIVASSCSLWYFNKSVYGQILVSVYRGLFYHLGSIAYGSLLISVFWPLKFLFGWFAWVAAYAEKKENQAMKFVATCLFVCLYCFDKFLQYLDRNAYVQIALQGKGFCDSARTAKNLFEQNAGNTTITEGLGNLIILIGKTLITGAAVLTGYMIITNTTLYKKELYSTIAPTICFFAVSYVISAIFMSVYDIAITTIFQCYLAEEEISKRQRRPPRHCPEELTDFMKKSRNNH